MATSKKSALFMDELKDIIKEDMKEHQHTRVSFEEYLKLVDPSHTPSFMKIEQRPPEKPLNVHFSKVLVVRLTSPNPQRLALDAPVLISRATCIIDAQSTSGLYKDKNMVVKVSWSETDRNNEKDIIDVAVEELQKSNSNLVNYLPKVFGSMDIPLSETGHIKEMLNLKAVVEGRRRPRVLRLLLCQRLEHLDEIIDEKQFTDAWIDFLKCHYALWNMGIVHHGDISVWNLMWDNTKSCGVLNDFDLAVVNDSRKRVTKPTGTLPFIARDFLDPVFYNKNPARLYSHEVESFVWVLVWLTLRPLSKLPSSQEWRLSADRDVVLWRKCSFMIACMNNTFFTELADKTNFKYGHTWKKCLALLRLMKKFDKFEGDGIQVNETAAQKIHDEVLKIMATNNLLL